MGIEEKLRGRGGDVSQASCWESSQKQLPSSPVLSITEILSQTRETLLQHLSLKLPCFDVKNSWQPFFAALQKLWELLGHNAITVLFVTAESSQQATASLFAAVSDAAQEIQTSFDFVSVCHGGCIEATLLADT